MPRRIRRNREHEALYKALREGEAAVFDTYKDILLMAACLGFKYGRRVEFESTAEPIEWDVFSGRTDAPLVNAIALMETGDVNVLLEDEDTMDRKFRILEEYANGGFEILKNHLLDTPGDPLDNLLSLIDKERRRNATDAESLTSVVDELFTS